MRRELKYPPFGRLAYLGVAGVSLPLATAAAERLAQSLRAQFLNVGVLGPAPDPLPKARGEFRFRIAVKTDREDVLLDACAAAQKEKLPADVRLTVVVDPR